jgi:hypothetical protein
MPTSKCPYGVSPTKVSKVGELTNVLDDLLKQTKAKVLHLKANKNKLSEKLIGLKFSMEDRHVPALET